jgi:hypothetical protein
MAYPGTEPLSPLAIRGKALETFMRTAPATTRSGLELLSERLDRDNGDLADDYAGLHDELGCYLNERAWVDSARYLAKMKDEFDLYTAWLAEPAALADSIRKDFPRLLAQIHGRLAGGNSDFRQVPVNILPDAAGNSIEFPDPGDCPALIDRLGYYVASHFDDNPAICAMAAYCGIIHAHPFEDGNGRTARTLFNLLLSAGSQSRHFIPLVRLQALRHGSFLIKMRRAFYEGDWNGFQAFCGDAARVSVRLQALQPGLPGAQPAPLAAECAL